MTQFQDPYGDAAQGPAKTSGLAIGALVCSLIFFCPVTTVLGPILGLIALATIGTNPARKGKGLAVVAILLGVLLTVGWIYGGYKIYGVGKLFYETVETGPRDALTAGFAGDFDGFKNAFYGPGAQASDAEAQAFIDELRGRYGEFVGSRMDESRMQGRSTQPQPGEAQMPFPYLLEFTNETVEAEVEIVFADPQAQPQTIGEAFINKLGYIEVLDEERGTLRYPPSLPAEEDGDDGMPEGE
jgi:hypothetical protein